MLPTALIKLGNAEKTTGSIRCLLDTGSMLNIVTVDSLANHDFQIRPNITKIFGIEGNLGLRATGIVYCGIYNNRVPSKLVAYAHFVVVAKLDIQTPSCSLSSALAMDDNTSSLADPEYFNRGPIGAIIGAGTLAELIYNADGMTSGLKMMDTALGRVVLGTEIDVFAGGNQGTVAVIHEGTFEELNQALTRLWEMDDVPENAEMSPDDLWCEKQFAETHRRDATGRYVVELPIRPEKLLTLGNTRERALRLFFAMERRLLKNPDWQAKYVAFMQEYEADGHMIEAYDVPNDDGIRVYISHHALSADKKFRVVFNGSMESSNGMTLNKTHCKGPRLQSDLSDQINLFRTGKVAMTADIRKMFRMIRVSPKHYNRQRIFWRESTKDRLKEYFLVTVTYGLASSSYLAVKALQQCGSDHADQYPMATKITKTNFYMDDLLYSTNSVEEAIESRKQLDQCLGKGGFVLAKWSSNENGVLMANEMQTEIEFKEPDSTSILGLKWTPSTDMLKFKMKPYDRAITITKKSIVSEAARLYDPSGFLGPVTLRSKLIIQDTWRNGTDWLKEVNPEIRQRWLDFSDDIRNAEKFEIPRWIGTTAESRIELHIFNDASKKAMASVAYIRHTDTKGMASAMLVNSKNKLASISTIMSIPRMELNACTIGAKMAGKIATTYSIPKEDIYLWTDSEVVLHWLNRSPHESKLFVGHRVQQIQARILTRNCRYVPSKENPADILSRGTSVTELLALKSWLNGPEFLKSSEEAWPIWSKHKSSKQSLDEVEKEIIKKRGAILAMLASRVQNGQIIEELIIDTQSEYRSALRATAYVFRFIANCRKCIANRRRQVDTESQAEHIESNDDSDVPVVAAVTRKRTAGIVQDQAKRRKRILDGIVSATKGNVLARVIDPKIADLLEHVPPIDQDEYEVAERYWVKYTQKHTYKTEYRQLEKHRPLPDKNPISSFSPFIDGHGCIRIRGRLQEADIPYEQKHPYLLHGKTTLAIRLMEDAHARTLHGHVQVAMRFLREKFWIEQLRNGMKNIIHKCPVCVRYNRKASEQMMGSLPADRCNLSKPFSTVSVDYGGPYKVKSWTGKKTHVETKAYFAVFVCCATRAAHLEPVSDATSKAYLAAMDRVIARRGTIRTIRSDCGLQFVGCIKELESALQTWNFGELQAEMAKRGIVWYYNTPYASHKAGLHEAAVRSAKYHIKRAVGEHILTFEEFSTLLARVEAVLNSRPMIAMSDDPNDMNPITPAHFLHGESIVRPLGPSVKDTPDNRLDRWELLHKMEQRFAQWWRHDYLAFKQQRNKWKAPKENMSVGELVFLVDDNLPPGQWLIGRIESTIPGRDGLVRNVVVKTKHGNYTRDITKCCHLPIIPEAAKIVSSRSSEETKQYIESGTHSIESEAETGTESGNEA